MFDVTRIVALLAAGVACVRARFLEGLLVVLAVAIIDTPTMLLPLIDHSQSPANAFYAFVLVLWGPSGMPTPPTPWTANSAPR